MKDRKSAIRLLKVFNSLVEAYVLARGRNGLLLHHIDEFRLDDWLEDCTGRPLVSKSSDWRGIESEWVLLFEYFDEPRPHRWGTTEELLFIDEFIGLCNDIATTEKSHDALRDIKKKLKANLFYAQEDQDKTFEVLEHHTIPLIKKAVRLLEED